MNDLNLDSLPTEPGIYKMLDGVGNVIYVGKSKNIRKRVKSYFSNSKRHDFKTSVMVSHIVKVECVVVNSESEALLLENQFIKSYRPKYNILLKDDKSFPYIKITINETFPRLLVVRERINDDALYFGPYSSMGSTKYLLRMFHDIFPIRDCKQTIDLINQQPKCIKLDIGKCIGPCVIKTVKLEYDLLIEQLILLLTGKNKKILQMLNDRMFQLSDQHKYEQAAVYRDRIKKISELVQHSLVNFDPQFNAQIWALYQKENQYYFLIQIIKTGQLISQKGFYLLNDDLQDVDDFIFQSCLSLYDEMVDLPDTILCNQSFKTYSIVNSFLADKKLLFPKKGIKREVVDAAEKNAKVSFARVVYDHSNQRKSDYQDLKQAFEDRLGFSIAPERCFGFDISHLQGSDIVASCVCFDQFKPNKSFYRRFKIRSVQEKSNDPESMYEVVFRRLSMCLNNKEKMPQLLLIDGGIAQLNFAMKAVHELNLSSCLTVFSIAKKFELIYTDSGKIYSLKRQDPLLKFFQRVRDESHRFAVSYQRVRRKKRFFDEN